MSSYLGDAKAWADNEKRVLESYKTEPCPTCGALLADPPECTTVLHRLAHRSTIQAGGQL